MELEISKTNNGPWPVKAQSDSAELVFSGDFSKPRITSERTDEIFDKVSTFTMWALVVLGFVAFVLSALQGAQGKNPWFWLNHSLYNLVFWVAALAGCHLWAKLKQEGLEQRGLNLLHWEEMAKTSRKSSIDVYFLFNKAAKKSWNNALSVAEGRNIKTSALLGRPYDKSSVSVTSTDLFVALLNDYSIQLVFYRLGVNVDDIKKLLTNYEALSVVSPSGELDELPFIAFRESVKLHNRTIDPLMLLCGLALLLPQDHIIQAIFFNIGLTIEKIEVISSWIFNVRLLGEDLKLFKKLAKFKPDNEINKGLTSVPTPNLDRYSSDMTWLAKHAALPIALGRAADLSELFKLLSDGARNIIVKGPEGSGRTTLLNELAYKMVTEQVPPILQDKRLIKLEISAVLGNNQKAENTFMRALQEALMAGNIILVIEDMHILAESQTTTGLSLLELLTNFLQNHPLTVFGTTTVEDYSDYLHDASNFEGAFTSYELSHLSKEGIILACCIKASLLENKDRCFFRYQSIEQAVEATDLYVRGASQPQKAISILVEAATRAKSTKNGLITEDMVQKIISEKTHIPTQNFGQNEADKLLRLEEIMAKYIVGQKPAITALAEGLRRARSGLSSVTRPLASFLFLGPTGVGKTEVAKTLANVYFGEEKYLLRLDMSEYRGPEGLTKLLGRPESKTDTPLIKHLKNYPFCLLLCDEFEKASPEIYNLFLQILEDGRLTSGRGETLDLTHALIIATSNAGTREIQEGLRERKAMDQIKSQLFGQTLLNLFPPELLNRFDSVVLFSPLSQEEVQRIAFLQLEYLRAKLKDKGIKVEFSDSVISDISTNAFDPLLGARPIRRYVQDHVEGFIAKMLLANQLSRGSEVTIDQKDGQYIVK